MHPGPTPAAVLWDFDGTMVDSEPIWARVQSDILAEHGLSWGPEQMLALVGQSAEVAATLMAREIGEPAAAGELLRVTQQRVAAQLERGLPWLPGARELLEAVTGAGVRCAVVTATNRAVMDSVLSQLPPQVEFVVCGDDVARPKPHPDGYLEATRRLGVSAADVLVIEDSVPGTQAALASGAVVYAVPALARLEQHPRMRVSATGLRHTTWTELVDFWMEREQ